MIAFVNNFSNPLTKGFRIILGKGKNTIKAKPTPTCMV